MAPTTSAGRRDVEDRQADQLHPADDADGQQHQLQTTEDERLAPEII